jgi:hypothetical protein
MADFCNVCSEELFGKEITPEIDVYDILENQLKPGYIVSVLCEGCGMSNIAKDQSGSPYLYFDYQDGGDSPAVTIEDWVNGKKKQF